MKRSLFYCVLALALCAAAMANIIPTNTTITGPVAGQFTWSYSATLSSDQNANSGFAPSVNPVPHTNLTFGAFFTLYDFAGYIAGTCVGPAGWTCLDIQNVGFTPDDVLPPDNPSIVNITFSYTSGPTLLGQPSGLEIGTFSAKSIYGIPTQISYTSRGIKNNGLQTGTISDNVGNTSGPSGVPEPATVVMLGAGLAILGLIRKKVRSA